jgi:4-hydroxybenzoate polyprenyltransferase
LRLMSEKLSEKLLLCLKSRSIVIIIYAWPALISFLISSISASTFSVFDLIRVMTAVSLVGYGVYFYNDLMDLEDDLKNMEVGSSFPGNRPLGSGQVTRGDLKTFIALVSATGLLLAYSINVRVFVYQLAYLTLGYLYSTDPVRLKKRFIMKQLTIAMGIILADLSGAYTVGMFNSQIVLLIAMHIVLALGVNPIVDLRDIHGDRAMGVKTIAVVLGADTTVRLYFATLIGMGVASVIGYTQMGLSRAVPILAVTVLSAWIYVSVPLLRKDVRLNYDWEVLLRRVSPFLMGIQLVPLLSMVLPL